MTSTQKIHQLYLDDTSGLPFSLPLPGGIVEASINDKWCSFEKVQQKINNLWYSHSITVILPQEQMSTHVVQDKDDNVILQPAS